MMQPPAARSLSACLASTEEVIEEARSRRPFVMVDDEDRENEGDLVIPAQFATPAVITASCSSRHQRFGTCSLWRSRAESCGLVLQPGPAMPQHFLLSAAVCSLSVAKIMRMSERGVENVFRSLR